eukprot:gene9435-12714_t
MGENDTVLIMEEPDTAVINFISKEQLSENISVYCKHWLKNHYCIYNETSVYGLIGGRHKTRVHNTSRASIIRRWLINTFGIEYLNNGSGVVDVAGGKGELSCELINLNHIQCTVIDPRELEIKKFIRRFSLGYYDHNPIFSHYNKPSNIDYCNSDEMPSQITNELSNTLFEYNHLQLVKFFFEKSIILPYHLQCLFEMPNYNSSYDNNNNDDNINERTPLFLKSNESFFSSISDIKSTSYEDHDFKNNNENIVNFDNFRLKDYKKAQEIIQNCSIIVGVHPDQATEHIIDFSLRNNKPFAIVPCCVCNKQFPKRKTSDGMSVKVYKDFIDYLIAKSDSIKAVQMDFEGRNILLYSIPSYVPIGIQPDTIMPLICKGIANYENWKNMK